MDTLLTRIVHDFPELKIVLEHVTTGGGRVRARLPPTSAPRLRPICRGRAMHLRGQFPATAFVLPADPQAGAHRQALIAAATSGNPRFFRHGLGAACETQGDATATAAWHGVEPGASARRHGRRSWRVSRVTSALIYGLLRNLTQCGRWCASPGMFRRSIRLARSRLCAALGSDSLAGAKPTSAARAVAWRVGWGILAVRSQPDRRRPGNRGEESPGSAEQDAG